MTQHICWRFAVQTVIQQVYSKSPTNPCNVVSAVGLNAVSCVKSRLCDVTGRPTRCPSDWITDCGKCWKFPFELSVRRTVYLQPMGRTTQMSRVHLTNQGGVPAGSLRIDVFKNDDCINKHRNLVFIVIVYYLVVLLCSNARHPKSKHRRLNDVTDEMILI
jgi:hypothetical protein